MGSSTSPDKGVRDMTEISNIDELGINRNLKVRYDRDEIYVSFFENPLSILIFIYFSNNLFRLNIYSKGNSLQSNRYLKYAKCEPKEFHPQIICKP